MYKYIIKRVCDNCQNTVFDNASSWEKPTPEEMEKHYKVCPKCWIINWQEIEKNKKYQQDYFRYL